MAKCNICNDRKEIEVIVMGTDTDWVECPYCKPDEKTVERIKKINKLQKVCDKKIYTNSIKTNKKDMRKNKKSNSSLNLRIYKKICQLVKIETIYDKDGYPINYLVQTRQNNKQEWHTILETISLKKAIQKKHFQILVVVRDLGYRSEFLTRRKKRKNK
jgi:hypothetical protein